MKKTKRLVKKIQQAPEATRVMWLWGLMAIAGIAVIGIWLISFNARIARINTDIVIGARSAPTLLGIFRAGAQTIASQTAQGLALILQSRSVEVTVPRHTFVYEELEPIRVVTLP